MCIYNVGIIGVSLIYIYIYIIINGEWINLYVCVYNSCYDIVYIYIYIPTIIVVMSENVELSRNMSMLMGKNIPPVD